MSGATMNDPGGVVRITVAGALYALPLAIVRDVIAPPPVTRVPHGPRLLLGLASHRGKIVPLFDLAGLLCRPHPRAEQRFVVVCTSGAREAAFLVEDVGEVSPLSTTGDNVPQLDVFSLLDMPHARAA